MNHRTIVLGRLVIAPCTQGQGAPVLDGGLMVCDEQGWRAGSVVIRFSRQPGRALSIGWKGGPGWPSLALMQVRHPVAARLFRPLLVGRFGR